MMLRDAKLLLAVVAYVSAAAAPLAAAGCGPSFKEQHGDPVHQAPWYPRWYPPSRQPAQAGQPTAAGDPPGWSTAGAFSSTAWFGDDHRFESGLGGHRYHERGKASYYADTLAGNRTASGDSYDPKLATAAHRTLPFNTLVDVVRDDGHWVRVRINDRGPFVAERVIDLSRRAAELLGMVDEGVANVSIYIVQRP